MTAALDALDAEIAYFENGTKRFPPLTLNHLREIRSALATRQAPPPPSQPAGYDADGYSTEVLLAERRNDPERQRLVNAAAAEWKLRQRLDAPEHPGEDAPVGGLDEFDARFAAAAEFMQGMAAEVVATEGGTTSPATARQDKAETGSAQPEGVSGARASRSEVPTLAFAVYDEHGKPADDRVSDYGWRCFVNGRCANAPSARVAEPADLREWMRNNMTFYDTADKLVPTLASVSKRIWYHATDDTESYPFDSVIDAALSTRPAQEQT